MRQHPARARWPDHELGLGVPFPRLEALLDGIVRTIAATETEARKKALADRCAAAGVDLNLPEGKSYFSRR